MSAQFHCILAELGVILVHLGAIPVALGSFFCCHGANLFYLVPLWLDFVPHWLKLMASLSYLAPFFLNYLNILHIFFIICARNTFFQVSQTYQFNIIFKLILNMFYFIPPALFLSSTCSLAILHLLSSYSPSAAFLIPPALFPARWLHSYPPNSYLPTCSLLTPAPFPHLLSSQSRP